MTLLISIEGWCEAGQHSNIFMPPCPLACEILIAWIIVNKATVNLGGIGDSILEKSFLKGWKVHADISV
jgi:hypothetical protein